jgi:predicted enzyme related to lactoylglutathione lyase
MSTQEVAMRIKPLLLASIISAAVLIAIGPASAGSTATHSAAAETPQVAVGAQYNTTHVYVPVEDFDRFVASIIATFGGSTAQKGVFQMTPTPSQTMSQVAFTPVGTFSVFGFKTPIPYPFGAERTGYFVTDMDAAVQAARAHGADVLVAIFLDPIGRDAVIQWPGGVNMQLYWHTKAPSYAALQTVPENRVYVSPDRADAFVRAFTGFAHGRILADNAGAPGVEIGRPNDTYRRIRIESPFGKVIVTVTDGHLPYPYGRELTGYEVSNVADTLSKAKAAGATVLVEPFRSSDGASAMVQFPGGYIAEIHLPIAR